MLMGMQIPEEAVEAAAQAMRDKYATEVTELPMSSFLGDARTALEAAAQHLMTAAFDAQADKIREAQEEAWNQGWADTVEADMIGIPVKLNPYMESQE